MPRRFLFLLLTLLAPFTLTAQGDPVDILLLSSHTAASEWEQRMLQPIHSLALDRPDLNISISRLQFLGHPNVQSVEHARDSVLASFTVAPRMVILLGGSCFGFAEDVQYRWNGIPILLIGEQDYFCDLQYALHGPGDPKAHRYPVTNLQNKGCNLTLINAPSFVRRTVEMILQVQPDLKKLFFIAGENYLSKERQWRLEQYLEENHPEISYKAISPSNTSTDQLLSILERENAPTTAVYFGSWMIREGYQENVSTRHNTVSLIENIAPVYTLFGSDLEKHPYVVGYYSFSMEEYGRTVRQRILDVLDYNIPPSEMPFANLYAGIPTLNHRAMEHFGLDTSLIPEEAVVIGSPHTLWQAHKKQIMIVAVFLLIGLAIYTFLTMGHSLRSMKKARNIAEHANHIKTAFIQNMSHEVRTPLNAIIGFSQLLCLPEGTVTEQEKEEYLSYIMNNSQLLTIMVNDMLSLADMEQGRYIICKSPTNLNEMARQAIKAVEPRIPPGVILVRQPGLDEDARYITDGMRVQQIMINFLTNACKHTTRGHILFGSSLVENPGHITFYVADTGTGVPAEKSESIFDRFVKLDNNKQGAGLGLSICRMIAESLGGKVWLDTQYKEGARFVLSFPREEA